MVLRYFQSTDYPHVLSLEDLTKKLTTLLAIITAQKCQTLAKLDISHFQDMPNRILFHIRDKLKTTRPGKYMTLIKILSYPEDGKLCSVAQIREYINKTKNLSHHHQFLVSYHKLHDAVTNAMTSCWVKTTLANARIDTRTFLAHSSRAASTSSGLSSGIPLEDALHAEGGV